MIKLTRLDRSEIHINPDVIEHMEETPDTHIIMTNGNRFVVLEPVAVIVEKVIGYKARIVSRGASPTKPRYLRKHHGVRFRRSNRP